MFKVRGRRRKLHLKIGVFRFFGECVRDLCVRMRVCVLMCCCACVCAPMRVCVSWITRRRGGKQLKTDMESGGGGQRAGLWPRKDGCLATKPRGKRCEDRCLLSLKPAYHRLQREDRCLFSLK